MRLLKIWRVIVVLLVGYILRLEDISRASVFIQIDARAEYHCWTYVEWLVDVLLSTLLLFVLLVLPQWLQLVLVQQDCLISLVIGVVNKKRLVTRLYVA